MAFVCCGPRMIFFDGGKWFRHQGFACSSTSPHPPPFSGLPPNYPACLYLVVFIFFILNNEDPQKDLLEGGAQIHASAPYPPPGGAGYNGGTEKIQ